MKQEVFLTKGRNAYLGSMQRSFIQVHGTKALPMSFAYICPCCGEVWARAFIANRPWQVLSRSCLECNKGWNGGEPGSLSLLWDGDYNQSFTPDMIAYELEIMLNFYEKSLKE